MLIILFEHIWIIIIFLSFFKDTFLMIFVYIIILYDFPTLSLS